MSKTNFVDLCEMTFESVTGIKKCSVCNGTGLIKDSCDIPESFEYDDSDYKTKCENILKTIERLTIGEKCLNCNGKGKYYNYFEWERSIFETKHKKLMDSFYPQQEIFLFSDKGEEEKLQFKWENMEPKKIR
jgi:RecJ-like exonuclease